MPPRLDPIRTIGPRQRLDGRSDLLDHPRDRQRREIRLVEIRRVQLDAGSRSFAGEEGGLRRPRRRGEAVEVEDVNVIVMSDYSFVVQPGRQRHWIDASPSVE